jgi:hypothetical protein
MMRRAMPGNECMSKRPVIPFHAADALVPGFLIQLLSFVIILHSSSYVPCLILFPASRIPEGVCLLRELRVSVVP